MTPADPPPAPAAKPSPAKPSPAKPPPARPPQPPVDLGSLVEKGAVWAFAGLGALLLVIAALFGLREAIAYGLFGPVARFGFGVGVGLGAWGVAELLAWRKYPTPSSALSGAGAAILYGTLYAGHARWGIVGQSPTFALMCGVTGVTMLLAERRASRFVALFALIGGYSTPILLSTGENQALAFFGYLALVNGGVLLVAARRRWPDFVVLPGLATLALYAGWMATFRAPDQVVVGFGGAAIFAGLWLASARPRSDTWPDRVAAGAAFGVALAFWLMAAAGLATPTDPLVIDRVSSLPLGWDLGRTAWFGAAWVVLGAGVFPWLGRGHVLSRVAAGAVVGLGTLVWASSWVLAGEPRWDVVAIVLPVAGLVAGLAGGLEGGLLVAAGSGVALVVCALGGPVPAAYLPVLTGGLLVAALGTGWRAASRWPLVALGVVVVAPLWVGVGDRAEDGEIAALAMATLPLYAALALGPFLRPRRADLAGALAGVLAPLALSWPLYALWRGALGDEVDGVLPLLLGANALLAALVLVRGVRSRAGDKEVVLLITLTLVGVALAVPMQVETTWLTVGWALLIPLLAWVNRRVPHPLFVGFATVLALAVGSRLLVNPYALEYGHGDGPFLFNWTLYTWGIPTVCLLVGARTFPERWLAVGLRTLAVLTGFALVNLEIAHTFARDGELSFRSERLAEEMTRSISWGGYGLFLIVIGIRNRSRAVRLGGLAFTVLGAAKVFVVDLWSLSGFARVGAFGGMAVTLLAGAVAFAWLVRNDQPPSQNQEPQA